MATSPAVQLIAKGIRHECLFARTTSSGEVSVQV